MAEPGSDTAGTLAPVAAFRAEARRLSEVLDALSEASFARPSPCPPWTVGELLCHLRVAVGRLTTMLAPSGPVPSGPAASGPAASGPVPSRPVPSGPVREPGQLTTATGYYRNDHRFSSGTNADRIGLAQRMAAGQDGTTLAREFCQAWQQAAAVLEAAPAGTVVMTRHGDPMLVTEFARTRVLELAVHGLDLAAALGREPWLTPPAAQVVEEVLLPAEVAAGLRRDLGWDRAALIAAATGRRQLSAAETALLRHRDVHWLSFG